MSGGGAGPGRAAGRPTGPRQTPPPPVFLERQSYRRRRLADLARLLPLFGALLFAVPLLWTGDSPTGQMATSTATIYIFSIWAGLILVNAVFGRLARSWSGHEAAPDPGDG